MGRERYTPQQQEFYKQYINSPLWRTRKAARIKLAGGQCEFTKTNYLPGQTVEIRCSRQRYLCVHHNTYERLGDELDKDLDVFCWPHHMIEHLLWKKCTLCGEPCLGYDALAEFWLAATLAQMQIDVDYGAVNWKRLPTKEQLADQIDAQCMRCRGITLTG